jgi:hypothetical protein
VLIAPAACGGTGDLVAEGYSGDTRRAIERADEILSEAYGIEAERVIAADCIGCDSGAGTWSILFASSSGESCVYLEQRGNTITLMEGSKTPNCA